MINWTTIDTVLLDLDGTLLDLHFDNHFWQVHLVKRYAEQFSLPENQAKEKLFDAFKAVEGTQNWYCLDYWQDTLNIDILALKHEVQHLIAIHPYVETFLQQTRNKKQLVLVTNAHPDSLNLKLNKTQIDQYFDKIISAHEYGAPKEALAFWHKLSDDIAFNRQRTLLVEDNLDVLRTAKNYGISQLMAITRPDSKKELIDINEFPASESFKVLLPGNLE